ncbi:hypothetical protein [Paenibacillus sp. FSL H8-0260]|uniref:hypothetical protein n=1 Tax=Paenibacillus sp. FSL H8-0260 TaxID=2921380 RepID=UPI00324C921A
MSALLVGDEVEIIQECGGHIEGSWPEIYKEGEKYKSLRVINVSNRDLAEGTTSDKKGYILQDDARFFVPREAIKSQGYRHEDQL